MTDLLVDIGNSSIKWMLSQQDNLGQQSRLSYNESCSTESIKDILSQLEVPDRIFSCSVNEKLWTIFSSACQDVWQLVPVKITSPAAGQGLNNAYAEASDLGSDRWCAMLGSLKYISRYGLVIDCGTALTIDLVKLSEQGANHMGGYILPGLKLMKQSLLSSTDQVNFAADNINLKSSSDISPGDTTWKCVEHGALLSLVASAEKIFNDLRQELKSKGEDDTVDCFLTGGYAGILSELLSIPHREIPDLVFRGLQRIANET